jgi:hypothetical protein
MARMCCEQPKSEVVMCAVLTVFVAVEAASRYSNPSNKSWSDECSIGLARCPCRQSGKVFCWAGDGVLSAAWLLGT